MSHCDSHLSKVCPCLPTACVETLDDMEFDRGIWYAAQHGDLERVDRLAARGVDAQDRAGYTALHHAARAGHLTVCRRLLELGASIDARTRAAQATPLHRAVTAGRTTIVKILLEAGADSKLKDSDGQTAMHRAVGAGHFEILELLLQYDRSSLTEPDSRGRLPLHLVDETSSAENKSNLRKLLQ